jgi:iron complex transport system substrate-binding protein
VLASIAAVATRAGVPERGPALVAALRERLADVAARVAGRAGPRVAVVEWIDPPFTAGHWLPDLVTAAGGVPVGATPGERSVPTSWAALATAAPDVVVVAPCGYHLDGAAAQARAVLAELPEVPVWAIDADGLIVRPGPRVVDGVEALAAILHPDVAVPRPNAVRQVR